MSEENKTILTDEQLDKVCEVAAACRIPDNDIEYKPDAKYIVWDSETFQPRPANENEFDGWRIVQEPTPHGFSSIPIVYLKDEKGACWSPVQHLIDKLEMALSQLFENNKSYAFRIMVVKGGVNIVGDLKGHARAMAFKDKDGDAKFMEKADASSSFACVFRVQPG